VSSFLLAHQHILGYSVPENGVKNVIKERKYNEDYLAMVMCSASDIWHLD